MSTDYKWRQWAQSITGLVSPTHTDAHLRRAVDIKMAQDREELMATIRHMRHKLSRIIEIIPPDRAYLSDDRSRFLAMIKDIAMEQSPSHTSKDASLYLVKEDK